MPSPHAHAHAHQHTGSVSATAAAAGAASNTTTTTHTTTSSVSLPQSAFNFNLNSASHPNLSQASLSASLSNNPTSRSATPSSQLTLGSSRKPSSSQQPQHNNSSQLQFQYLLQQPLPPSPPQQQHHNFHQHYHQQQQQQQQQYHDPSFSAAHVSRPIYGSVQYNPAHRPSHIANSVNLTPSFSSGSLPRTSSLLPPPSLTLDQSSSSPSSAWNQPALLNPFSNAPAAVPVPADPVNDREFDDSVSPKNTRRRHSKSHSRSSSLGGLSDGFRNLNRWSISTASSRASNPASASAKRFSRRMSIDSTALFSQSSSPRRLHKSRPSTAGGSPEDARHHYYHQQQPSVPPLASLPPIVQLPSLSQDDLVGAALSGRNPKPDRKTFFTGPGSDVESGTFWDDSSRAGETSYLSTSARNTPDPCLPTSAFSRDAIMPHPEDGTANREKGHSRSRSQGLKSSTDSTSSQRNPSRSKLPSQKAMLSRALQKANTAVQLDNAQNFQGARSSYREACDLLHQVLLRTAGDEDKKKLEAIRKTYASRIEELDQMLPDEEPETKALPQRPRSNSTSSIPPVAGRTRNGSVATVDPRDDQPSRLRSDSERSQASQRAVPNYARPTSVAWRPTHSPKPSLDGARYVTATPTNFSEPYTRSQSAFSQTSPRRDRLAQPDTFLARPMEDEYKPPPLSPRRPISPNKFGPDVSVRSDFSSDMNRLAPTPSSQRGHQHSNSHESISWLDPIDESAGSSASSVHSRSSSMGVRRKHIRSASGDTEAEFDAALDDAIEAAYDDGYESTDPPQRAVNLDQVVDEDDVIAQALKKVQLAKERVRQSELEMQRLANDRSQRMKALQEEEQTLPGDFYDGDDSEEEERILEEMTSGYAIDSFTLEDQSARSRMPRESDSSELTSRTWHSSTMSNPPTANTVLSPVTEGTVTIPSLSKSQGPIAPPPSQSLPKLPPGPPGRPPSSGGRDSVRDRRLSGTNAKQLKIETQKLGPKVQEPATAGPMMQSKDSLAGPQQPKTAGVVGQQQRQTVGAAPVSGPSATRSASQLRGGPSPVPSGLAAQGPPPTPPVPAGPDGPVDARPESPAVSRAPGLRKNFSSNSLKSMKTRNLSITNIDEFSDGSPGTPLSNQFGGAPAPRLPALPSLPTPVAAAFRDRVTSGSAAGGFHLFDNDIHSPASPGEQDAPSEDAPLPLEPCPTDVMLRPFWLMRALYQTLAHPKGGYISNKLFVPRDAWRVKGVKIKGMEEKTSQCDLLTAALQKLARVNSEDADALLEEMQSFENVLEQAQVFLTRRLGNEVGVQGAGTMFKDAEGVFEADGKPVPRNNSVSTKGTFSWRRLRSKTSSTGLGNSYERGGGKNSGAGLGGGAEGMSLSTLPMTDHPTSKPGKRDATGVQFSGPNANYMAALARLFDAAQTIDQIARQVEDPGLRHADKTQVGLELCTRHAAEFFAFYICRFVLQDLTLLLDKFIKRGSEWVMV